MQPFYFLKSPWNEYRFLNNLEYLVNLKGIWIFQGAFVYLLCHYLSKLLYINQSDPGYIKKVPVCMWTIFNTAAPKITILARVSGGLWAFPVVVSRPRGCCVPSSVPRTSETRHLRSSDGFFFFFFEGGYIENGWCWRWKRLRMPICMLKECLSVVFSGPPRHSVSHCQPTLKDTHIHTKINK